MTHETKEEKKCISLEERIETLEKENKELRAEFAAISVIHRGLRDFLKATIHTQCASLAGIRAVMEKGVITAEDVKYFFQMATEHGLSTIGIKITNVDEEDMTSEERFAQEGIQEWNRGKKA